MPAGAVIIMVMGRAVESIKSERLTLQDSSSHRILRHMHEVLNIVKRNN